MMGILAECPVCRNKQSTIISCYRATVVSEDTGDIATGCTVIKTGGCRNTYSDAPGCSLNLTPWLHDAA